MFLGRLLRLAIPSPELDPHLRISAFPNFRKKKKPEDPSMMDDIFRLPNQGSYLK